MTNTNVKRKKRSEVAVDLTWDLTDLFSTHEEWEKELKAVQDDVNEFSQYKGKLKTDPSCLLNCISRLEKYEERLNIVATYASLRVSADGSDPNNQRDYAKISSALAKIEAKLSFIDSELLTLSEEHLSQFMEQEPTLTTYKKMLADLMDKKPYTFGPKVEEILSALSEIHRAPYMIYSRSKTADMKFQPIKDENGEELPMSDALYEDLYESEANTTIRRKAYDSFINTLHHYKNTYAATYATEVNKQVTLARLRNYKSVTHMLLHPQQVTEEMYHNQLDIIQRELAPHMRRYATLKKEKLQLDEMRFCDLKAPLDPNFNPKTTYTEAKETILAALEIMGPEYSKIMKKGLTERWVDLTENIGKSSGAFCASPYGVHPYILITWTDTMNSAFTLAHELGHAGHFYLAQQEQTLFNTRPSLYFIEAPSTMNELLLGHHLLQLSNQKQMKRWVINQLLGTYYHNFITHLLEGEFQRRVYTLVEKGTPLTADNLSNEKLEVLENFWGDAVKFDDGAGLTWMRQPHYYMGLYPYTYSAGLTVSTAMMKMIHQEGTTAVNRWLDVLKTGGTLKPLELIQKAGVDMSKPDAIKTAVEFVGSLIDELEKSY